MSDAGRDRKKSAWPEDDVRRHADDERKTVEQVGVDLGCRQVAVEAAVELNTPENAAVKSSEEISLVGTGESMADR